MGNLDLPMEYRDVVLTGDVHELAAQLPSGCIDLIFCDPLYDRSEDYAAVAAWGSRLLKPDGNALAFVNAKWFHAALFAAPTPWPPLACVQMSGASPMNGHLIAKTYYLLWWGSGKLAGYMPDGYVGKNWSAGGAHNFKWTKNPKYLRVVLEAFTRPGAVVFDPFAGGGSIPAMCKATGRHYVAFEREPERAELARELIAATQPPLFVQEPEQLVYEVPA